MRPRSDARRGFGERTDTWVRREDEGFRVGRPSGAAEVAGWLAFSDGDPVTEPIDVFALMLVAGAFAPVCFNRAEFPVGWAPTRDSSGLLVALSRQLALIPRSA